MRLHHVQVACPRGGEDVARRFYVEGLGLSEVAKPADLAARGGVWFRGYGAEGEVTAEIHLGVEEPFVAARKAHPALVVEGERALDALGDRLEALGFDVDRSQQQSFPGYRRFHTHDGHGNRVEVLARLAGSAGISGDEPGD